MSRNRLYWTTLDRPSRRHEPRPRTLQLRWDDHEQDYVHATSGSSLRGLIRVARSSGQRFSVEYPAPRRATFSVVLA